MLSIQETDALKARLHAKRAELIAKSGIKHTEAVRQMSKEERDEIKAAKQRVRENRRNNMSPVVLSPAPAPAENVQLTDPGQ